MRVMISIFALCLSLSLVSCTKKEAAPEGTGSAVEGTSSNAAEGGAPAEEMQQKKEGAASDAAPAEAPAASGENK
jgi:hypothetical protein